MVICDGTGRIVATGSLIVERKFIHALGQVGHIEDIAVLADQQGKKLGLRVIHTLDSVAAKWDVTRYVTTGSTNISQFFLGFSFFS